VEFSSQALVGPLDVGKRRAPLDTENDVEIHEIADFRVQISDCIADWIADWIADRNLQ
jgi:hypothetical protein